MSHILSRRQIWGPPVLLGVLSLVGLVAALVADGVGDALSWAALALPVAVCAAAFRRRSQQSPSPAPTPPLQVARPVGPLPRQ